LSEAVHHVRREPWLRREVNTMGIYVSIVLFSALTVGNDHGEQDQFVVLPIIWGTTLGLALAHWFALTLADWLEHEPSEHPIGWMLFGETAVAIAIALLATVAVLLLPDEYERLGARWTTSLFIGGLVYEARRSGGVSRRAAFLSAVIALLAAGAIAYIKWLIGH
jgi:hypothetical protein